MERWCNWNGWYTQLKNWIFCFFVNCFQGLYRVVHSVLSFTHTFGMRFGLIAWFITWRLAFSGMATEILPWFLSQVCFTVLRNCLRLHFWQSLRCFAVLGHFDSITARFFGVPAARFHLFSFFVCFMNKYDSRLLKCLFLPTSPIASSRVC